MKQVFEKKVDPVFPVDSVQWHKHRWFELPDVESMRRKMHWLCISSLAILTVLVGAWPEDRYEQTFSYTEPTTLFNNTINHGKTGGLHELHDSRVLQILRLKRSKSPYLLREDLYVERGGELIIESGVEIRFAPMVGITVRGIITAEVITHKNRNEILKKWSARFPGESLANGFPLRGENKGDRPFKISYYFNRGRWCQSNVSLERK